MKPAFLLFLCSMLTSCTASHYVPKNAVFEVPHADLTGPVPPANEEKEKAQPLDTLQSLLTKLHGNSRINPQDAKNSCILILEHFLTNKNPQVVLMALYAHTVIQLAPSENSCALLSQYDCMPQLQLALLSTLFETQSPLCSTACLQAMQIEEPIIRLQAAWILAKTRAPQALSSIESLESKFSQELAPFIAELYAQEGSQAAQMHIKRLIHSTESSTISSCFRMIRDCELTDLSKDLMLCVPSNPQEKEAYAYALGAFPSKQADKILSTMTHDANPCVALQAFISLSLHGERFSLPDLEPLLSSNSPFVFAHLAQTSLPTHDIESLWSHSLNAELRFALSCALLERKSQVAAPFLLDILMQEEPILLKRSLSLAETCSFLSIHSRGNALPQNAPSIFAESETTHSKLLHALAQISPEIFEQKSEQMLSQGALHIAPMVLAICTEHPSESRMLLLRKFSNQPGSPFIRNFCDLARIYLKDLPIEPKAISSLFKQLHESISMLEPYSTWQMLFLSQENIQRIHEEQRLYFQLISTLAQGKTEMCSKLLAEELSSAPEDLTPLIVAALLQTLL